MVAGILIAGGLAGLAVLKLREGIGFGSIGLPELTLAVAGIGAIYYWTHSQPRES